MFNTNIWEGECLILDSDIESVMVNISVFLNGTYYVRIDYMFDDTLNSYFTAFFIPLKEFYFLLSKVNYWYEKAITNGIKDPFLHKEITNTNLNIYTKNLSGVIFEDNENINIRFSFVFSGIDNSALLVNNSYYGDVKLDPIGLSINTIQFLLDELSENNLKLLYNNFKNLEKEKEKREKEINDFFD